MNYYQIENYNNYMKTEEYTNAPKQAKINIQYMDNGFVDLPNGGEF